MSVKAVSFVAEVSSNHHADLERCLAFVERSAQIGCSAVKFQLFRIRELFAPEALRFNAELLARQAWELSPEFVPLIAKRSQELGIQFACTPFDLDAVETLAGHVDFFKIASYELLWEDLLEACAETGKPIALSTGMATRDEVERAVEVLSGRGCADLTLLACTSAYPTPARDANLAAIETLREIGAGQNSLRFRVGWSDHTVEPGVIFRAIHRFSAEMVEFHLDIDGEGEEFSAGHCWLPDAIGEVIRSVGVGLDADGSPTIAPSEIETVERSWRADPHDGLRPLRSTRDGLNP